MKTSIELLNEAQGKIVSVGMNPDFKDLELGDSHWLPKTQEEACSLISRAIKAVSDEAVVHTSALNIGVNRVVCTCGEDFREHAYNGDAVHQFATHLREKSNN